jgi:hypothetical protein
MPHLATPLVSVSSVGEGENEEEAAFTLCIEESLHDLHQPQLAGTRSVSKYSIRYPFFEFACVPASASWYSFCELAGTALGVLLLLNEPRSIL